ncbi:unnamed protein product [Hydatigera taeniaeformis]|uniref:UDENN domain-containing protein n=1 Tax=Hydatigena taeniaeformis TaxID=6205 RepID=A0A158RDT7_HYDTA|nr:unnamed protein product [Hydatigera taeniaeformis]
MSSYVLVIGFHHKKGTSVEYVYPELETGIDLPSAWACIPPTALPDGAHNFDRDSIFFTVPSLEPKPTTLFGVACYRQIDAKDFSNRTPDLTRNTVQKSVVFLSHAPLFGLVFNLLDDITDAFIAAPSSKDGYELLLRGFFDIKLAVDRAICSTLCETEVLRGLSAVSFVRAYQRESLVLLKILLLERKILFTCETTVQCMSTWLLTLISLIPGMLLGGLSTCAIIDESWVDERACWPLATLSRSSIATSVIDDTSVTVPQSNDDAASLGGEDALSTSAECLLSKCDLGLTILSKREFPLLFLSLQAAQSPTSGSGGGLTRVAALRMGATNLWSNVTKTASVFSTRVGGGGEVGTEPPSLSSQLQPSPPQLPISDAYAMLPPLTDGSVFDSPLPTDDWGLPLALFSRSYLFLPYVPLHTVDMLLEHRHPPGDVAANALEIGGRRVRGFLCGTTNPLLSQNTRLAEVIVNTLPFPSETVGTSTPEATSEVHLESSGDTELEVSEPTSRPSLSDAHSNVRTSGVFSRLLNRQAATIRLCPPSTEPGGRLRDLPVPIGRAVQLSRLDRIFIDHLVNTAEMWYAARAAKDLSSVPVEEIGSRETIEAEIRTRFPELADLEKWIRAQFGVYIKSLLLTAEGRGSQLGDFNLNYIACFRTTHAFLAWRSQLVVPSVMNQILNQQKEEEEAAKEISQQAVAVSVECLKDGAEGAQKVLTTGATAVSSSKAAYAIACPLSHPGKNFPSSESADQIVSNLKQLSFLKPAYQVILPAFALRIARACVFVCTPISRICWLFWLK